MHIRFHFCNKSLVTAHAPDDARSRLTSGPPSRFDNTPLSDDTFPRGVLVDAQPRALGAEIEHEESWTMSEVTYAEPRTEEAFGD